MTQDWEGGARAHTLTRSPLSWLNAHFLLPLLVRRAGAIPAEDDLHAGHGRQRGHGLPGSLFVCLLACFFFFLPDRGFSFLARGSPLVPLSLAQCSVPGAVSVPEPGPYLLKMVFMRGTDDNGGMVCQDVFLDRGCRPQLGRWVSRTVLDHRDKELFVIRKR